MDQALSNKFVVGVTGGIGSGKSAVCQRFEQLGITCIDADRVAREVVEPHSFALLKIQQHFGQNIILADGKLDRTQLRAIIFNQPDEKRWLESLLHPIINTETQHQIESATSNYVIYTSPLLFETKQYKTVDRVLVIDVPVELQISRTEERDNINTELVKSILSSQASRSDRLTIADDVIVNDKSIDDLYLQVDQLHKLYLDLATYHDQ